MNVIRKIWSSGEEIIKEKVFETDDEQEAFYMEMEYIRYFGRANLTNLTDGGEGSSKLDAKSREDNTGKQIDFLIGRWRWTEREILRRNYPVFDRYSRTKLYPTKDEEPPSFRVFFEDGVGEEASFNNGE